ncbi:Mariner Mos1 transposase [Acromyrmex echinatior]|uniref:Mariner Mos1 transposase n=1 Tax=Acromyrmex echinatior TaxID=103372 RepID=F4WEW1_ACREC|nr:Mariner Mos1 transposase [Acromyrmex echinatior]
MSSFVPTNYDLRTALVFCYHLKKTAAESHRMLVEAYMLVNMLLVKQCFEWFKKFKSGDFDVRNEERGKPPKKFTDNELQALLDEDDTQTQQELADQLNVTQKTISIRLKAMGKIQKVGKWKTARKSKNHL